MKRWWLLVPALGAIAVGAWLWWPSARGPVPTGPELPNAELPWIANEDALAGRRDAKRVAADAGKELGPLPWLGGEVLDDTGPLAQADLEVQLRSTSPEPDCQPSARTRSVAGGGFEVGPLCPGQYDVRASRGAGVATAVVRLVRGKDRERVTLRLRKGTRLEVRVSDEKKAPVPAARIEVQDEVSGYVTHVLTDAKGLAIAQGLAARQHTVVARKDGYLTATVADRALAPIEDRVELVLWAGARLEGRVVDPDGQPLAGVDLRLGVRSKQLNGGVATQIFDDSTDGGFFSIGPVRPGAYLIVTKHPGYRRLEQAVRIPGPKVTLALSQGTALDGVFLDADGDVVEDTDISVEADDGENKVDVTIVDGGFHADGLSNGDWTVMGVGKGADAGLLGIAIAKLKVKGERRLQVTLAIERGEGISGKCIGAPGGAPADTNVIVVEEAMWRRLMLNGISLGAIKPGLATLANCQGAFHATGLKPGRYRLVACGNHEDPPTAATGTTDAIVTCPAVGRLRFRVVDSAGRPVTRYFVGPGRGELEEHPDGRYEQALNDDLDGTIEVHADGFALFQRHAKARQTEQIDLGELVMTAARRLEGRVVDANHQPVAGAEVRFNLDKPDAFFRARTQTDGTFELADVPSEASNLFVVHPDFKPAQKVVGAADLRVEVVLEPARRLSGTVITSDGRPALEYQVVARSGEVSASADVVDGRYELGSLAPGEWSLRLISTSRRTPVSGFSPVAITLSGAGTQSVDLVERIGGHDFSVAPIDEEGKPIDSSVWLVPGEISAPASANRMKVLERERGLEGDAAQALHPFTHVPSGKWTVVIHADNLPRMFWLTPIEVSPSMPSALRLAIPRGLTPAAP